MGRIILRSLIVMCFLFLSSSLIAADAEVKQAQEMFKNSDFSGAADVLSSYVSAKGAQVDPDVLLLYGKCLDKLTTKINTDAEIRCYRSSGAPRTPKCMFDYAARLNTKYGAGSFEFFPSIISIKYQGAQFDRVVSEFPNSKAAAEADYLKLTKNLIGRPDEVLPKIQAFLQKYSSGEWNRKGMLLWARINENIWWIHKNWSWVLYNGAISEDELIIKGEEYRQEAIRSYKKVKGGEEGKAASEELKLILDNKSSGKMYGILNESSIEGVNVELPPQK